GAHAGAQNQRAVDLSGRVAVASADEHHGVRERDDDEGREPGEDEEPLGPHGQRERPPMTAYSPGFQRALPAAFAAASASVARSTASFLCAASSRSSAAARKRDATSRRCSAAAPGPSGVASDRRWAASYA